MTTPFPCLYKPALIAKKSEVAAAMHFNDCWTYFTRLCGNAGMPYSWSQGMMASAPGSEHSMAQPQPSMPPMDQNMLHFYMQQQQQQQQASQHQQHASAQPHPHAQSQQAGMGLGPGQSQIQPGQPPWPSHPSMQPAQPYPPVMQPSAHSQQHHM